MKKHINTLIAGLLSVIFITGCSDFGDMNTNPDALTKITSELLATRLILDVVGEDNIGAKGKDYLYDDILSKYITISEGVIHGDLYNRLSRTNFTSLIILNNVSRMIESSPEGGLRNSYTALGHVLRAKKFFDLTMRVGDIPYSEAMQGDNDIYSPKYDSQKEVFLGILNELDEADRLFAEGVQFSGDPIYNGDPAKWRKAANALQLKLLINLYKKADDADLKIKERFQKVAARSLFTSNADNCQLVYTSKSFQNYPYYKDGNNDFMYIWMSSVTVDTLKLFGDRRIFYYAKPASALLTGSVTESDWDAYAGSSPFQKLQDIQADVNAKIVSTINDRYYELPAGEPIAMLSYSEMNFILAEAVVRNLMTGDAKSYYEEGIRAAMKFTADNTPDNPVYHHNMKITDDYISSYLTGSEVAFASTQAKQIRQIILQKYLATFLQQRHSGFLEYRRTGIPAFPINPETNLNVPADKMPVRWMYPQSELDYNGKNVEEAIKRQYASDDVNELMWILK